MSDDPTVYVEMKYQGPIQGPFHITAPVSGKRYDLTGRGDQFMADARDVEFFHSFQRYGQEYVIVVRQAHATYEPVLQPPPDFSVLPAETTLPDVTEMTVKEALRAIQAIDNLADLRVMAALENGTKQREKVLEAISVREQELSS